MMISQGTGIRINLSLAAWAAILTALLCVPSWADDAAATDHWPNFRGPNLDGSAQATGLAQRWSREEGLLWSTKLPGSGSSTPAIWGGRIFLTAVNAESGKLLAIGLDAANGKVLWQQAHGDNRRQGRNDMTAPSPVTDGRHVIFLFGTGLMVAYDFDGDKLWQRDLAAEFGPLSWLFAYGASPLMYEGKLYLQMMRRPTQRGVTLDEPLDSFLLAIDPATGKDLWKHSRPAEAVDESWESYITPTIHQQAGKSQIILAGADTVTAHSIEDGKELWRRDFNDRRLRNWRLVPTPVSDGRYVYMALPRGVSLAAVDPEKDSKRLEDASAWTMASNAPDVCSPLLYGGRLYVLDGDKRVVTCLDPKTGRQIWRGELGGQTVIRSSPTAADGKIYFIDESGLVFVLAAGDEFKVLSQIEMGGGQQSRSSIVIAGNRIYVRTADALHCVGPAGNKPAPQRVENSDTQ